MTGLLSREENRAWRAVVKERDGEVDRPNRDDPGAHTPIRGLRSGSGEGRQPRARL